MKHTIRMGVLALAGIVWAGTVVLAAPVGTAFTYQGQLKRAGAPVNDTCDFAFSLWNDPTSIAPAARVGGPIQYDGQGAFLPLGVENGLFDVRLDFGATVFNGTALYLEVSTRCPHDPGNAAAYSTLTPREPLTSAPYSLQTRGIFVADNGFVGFGRSTTISGAEYLGLRAPASGSNYGGMYVETSGATAKPFYGYATNGTPRAWTYVDGTSGSWRLNNGGDRLTITSAGDVGLGTLTPANKLSVIGNANVTGNVGIGTTNPKGRLDVEGDYYGLGHLWLHAYEGDGVSGTAFVQARDDSISSVINLQFRTKAGINLVDNMTLTPNNRVGIGTTTPSDRLDIGGGNIVMGYEIVNRNLDLNGLEWTERTILCPAGKKVLGGGCQVCMNGAAGVQSFPLGDGSGWECQLSPGDTCIGGTGWAICANIK